jgi:Putative zinc-finger
LKEKKGSQFVDCQAPSLTFLFPFYLNGDVTPEEARQIESHVPGCPECQRKLSCVVAIAEHGLPSWRNQSGGVRSGKKLAIHPRH